MPESPFHDQPNRRFRSIYAVNDINSPYSVIFPHESCFASIDRFSSTSDVIDHESSVSDTSLRSSSGGIRGSYLDLNKESAVRNNGGKEAAAIKEYGDAESQTLCSARSSFSYKECQYRKSRSEILLRKSDRRRPASLDLNNQAMSVTASSSPRLGSSMKASASSRRRGVFPSPGTPNIQKGWSSERVPLHTYTNRSMLMACNNGKALPSKWEDAERWIISPVSGDNGLKPSAQQQKRPKSKSGPLGPHGSPAVANFVTESPLLTGLNADYNSLNQYQNGHDNNGNISSLMDHCIARSVSIHGCSELLSHSLLRITQADKIGDSVNAATNVSHYGSRRDMATQMSPESSPCSSPTKTASSSILTVDLQHVRSKSDIRDVQVDDKVTLNPYAKKSRGQIPGSGTNIEEGWKNEGSEMRKSFSKVQREEAKITAWENLQKAKADAAMRKLEMKLEKKRSSSMDRIIHKLQSAQKKAQEMRESVLSNQPHDQLTKSSHKAVSFIKTRHVRFLPGCFTCPAF